MVIIVCWKGKSLRVWRRWLVIWILRIVLYVKDAYRSKWRLGKDSRLTLGLHDTIIVLELRYHDFNGASIIPQDNRIAKTMAMMEETCN